MTTWSGPRTTSHSNSSTTEPGRDAATCPAIAARTGIRPTRPTSRRPAGCTARAPHHRQTCCRRAHPRCMRRDPSADAFVELTRGESADTERDGARHSRPRGTHRSGIEAPTDRRHRVPASDAIRSSASLGSRGDLSDSAPWGVECGPRRLRRVSMVSGAICDRCGPGQRSRILPGDER
jgi:hypothetical protein